MQIVHGPKNLKYVLSTALQKKFEQPLFFYTDTWPKEQSTSVLLHCFSFLQVLPPCWWWWWYSFAIVLVCIFHVMDFLWLSGDQALHLCNSKVLKLWSVALPTWVWLIYWEALPEWGTLVGSGPLCYYL